AYRAHDLVELVDAIAVPVREHRHVTPGEGRLLVRDRVQRHGWIGNDALAIVASDLAVHIGTVGDLDAFALFALRGCADLCLRLQVYALRLKTAMIDAGINVEVGKPLVDMLGPTFAPPLDHLRAVPVALLLAEPVFIDFAHGEHDMGM